MAQGMHRRTDTLDFGNLGELFPIKRRMTYLNNASIGPLSEWVVEAVNAFLADVRDNGRKHYPDWCRIADKEIKPKIAGLINADASEIAFIKNTTEGLNIVANGLDWQAGDNVVIADIEYPSNVYPWMNLARRGVAVKWLKTENGRITPEAVRSCLDSHTRLASFSAVQFSNGFRLDLPSISQICRENNVLLNIDAIQMLGALPLDVSSVPIDFMSAGGHKWLLGPIGTGIFYCRRASLERLHPAVVGYHSVNKPEDHMDYDFTLREDAARFEEALVNFPGVWGLAQAVETIAALGDRRVEAHITRLLDMAVEGLTAKGYTILSPMKPAERSGILVFQHPAMPPDKLCDHLSAADVHAAVRGGGVRISPGVYNDAVDIQRMLEALP